MHELSIALSIIDGALEEAARLGVAQVCAIHLRLGRYSGVDKDALLFSYEVASRETALASSRLVIEEVEITVLCPECGERPSRSFPLLTCGECGAVAERLMHGDEMEITGMEVVT